MRHALLLLTFLPITSAAICTDQIWKPGWSSTYDGTIGRYPVRFELAQTGAAITGYYFYASRLKDIRLTGSITDGTHIRLQEWGADGKPEAAISAEFPDKDPQGKLKGELTCDLIVGAWQRPDGSNRFPVFLRLMASVPDPHGHRYLVAGAKDDEAIDRAAATFRKAVADGDAQTVAAMIRYPITVYINRKKTKIATREQLIANYSAIFTRGYRNAVVSSIPRDMFARYNGIMLGERGEVWFDDRGFVVALNNLLIK